MEFDDDSSFSQINVTPFVDVMLVLLVIFMVTAPLLTIGVSVDLPKTNAGTLDSKDEPLVITLDAKGVIFLQDSDQGINKARLLAQLEAIKGAQERRVFLRVDQELPYGEVMALIVVLQQADFHRIAFINAPQD